MDNNNQNFTPVTPPPPPVTPTPGAPSVPSFPSQPSSSDSPQPKAKSGGMVQFFFVFLAIVGVMALAGIGYAGWVYYHAPQPTVVMPTVAPRPAVTVVPTVSQDDSTATTEKELDQTTVGDHATDSATIDQGIDGL